METWSVVEMSDDPFWMLDYLVHAGAAVVYRRMTDHPARGVFSQ